MPTHEQHVLYGRIGGYTTAAKGKTNTLPARQAFDARFEKEVDPEGVLSPPERAKRALAARKAHFARLAMRSAEVRRNA